MEQWARSQTLPHHQVQRARMLLGHGGRHGASDETVARWRNRYLAEGLEGLVDRLRSGRPSPYTDTDREAMWKRLQADPPDGHTCWSLSLMARETGISTAQLSRWWSAAGLQPHRVRTFKLSDDPQFEAKLRDVIAVYEKGAPDRVRLYFDEKPRMQALVRTQAGLPATAGCHSTLSLKAALDLDTGRIYYACAARNRYQECLALLHQLARHFPT